MRLMGLELAKAHITVRADTNQATKDLKNAQPAIGQAASRLGGVIRSGLALAGVAMGISQVISQFRQFISLAERQILAEARMGAVVKGTGMAAGFTAEQLKKKASALQAVTMVGDEEILELQAKLLTFKSITGDVFDQATEVILNMAATMGTNASGAALQLGRALEDPIRGVSALRRTGVSFSEAQKDIIKQFVETNQLAKAQAYVLDTVQGQLGAVAREMAKTDAGKLQQARNVLGDMREELGKKMIPTAIRWTEIQMEMTELLPPLVEGFLEFSNLVVKLSKDFGELATATRDWVGVMMGVQGELDEPKMGFIASSFAAMRDANLQAQEMTLNAAMKFLDKESALYHYYNEKLEKVVNERAELTRRYWGDDEIVPVAKGGTGGTGRIQKEKDAAAKEKDAAAKKASTLTSSMLGAFAAPGMADKMKDMAILRVPAQAMSNVMSKIKPDMEVAIGVAKMFGTNLAAGLEKVNPALSKVMFSTAWKNLASMVQGPKSISEGLNNAADILTQKWMTPVQRIREEFENMKKVWNLLSPETRAAGLSGMESQLKGMTESQNPEVRGRFAMTGFGKAIQDALLAKKSPQVVELQKANTLLGEIRNFVSPERDRQSAPLSLTGPA